MTPCLFRRLCAPLLIASLASLAAPAAAQETPPAPSADQDAIRAPTGAPEGLSGEPADPALEALKRRVRAQQEWLDAERRKLAKRLDSAEEKRPDARRPTTMDGQPRARPVDEHLEARLDWQRRRRKALLRDALEEPSDDKTQALIDLDDEIETSLEDLREEDSLRLVGPFGLSFLRYEDRRNEGFDRRGDGDDRRVPMRFGLGAAWTIARLGRALVSGTLSRTYDAKNRARRRQDHLDLYEGFVEFFAIHDDHIELRFKLGRQALRFGNQRLLGDDSFFVDNRSFDALSIELATGPLNVTSFVGRPVQRKKIDDRRFNDPDWEEALTGITFLRRFAPGCTSEALILHKQNSSRGRSERGRSGASHTTTFSVNGLWTFDGGVFFGAEFIGQRGRIQGDSHESAAVVVELGWRSLYPEIDGELAADIDPLVVARGERVPRFTARLAASWARGDDDPADGRSQGFQPVYPSRHEFQGDADVLGFQNLLDLELELSYQWRSEPDAKGFSLASISLLGHHFIADSNRGAIIDSRGAPLLVGAQGQGGHEIGSELDLRVLLFGHLQLGVARFFPGQLFRRNGLDQQVDFVYFGIQ